MGKFTYESTVRADFEDRLLAHLQLVIGAKLRRGEAFHFMWKDDTSIGDGRTVVWVHPRSSLVYKFYGSRRPGINRAWVDALMYTANSSTGLYVVPEPAEIAQLSVDGGWLRVNDGEGVQRDALLWVTNGTPIALVPIPDQALA